MQPVAEMQLIAVLDLQVCPMLQAVACYRIRLPSPRRKMSCGKRTASMFRSHYKHAKNSLGGKGP